jgi:multimeric flavodoxin WrbA
MDADIEAIINEASVDAATTLTKSRIPKLGTGVIWFKATAQMITFFDTLTAQLNTGKFKDENDVLNAVLRSRPQQYTIANTIDNNPEAHFQPTTDAPETQANPLSYRYVSPFYFVNHPIFETDMHLHTSGYMSAFSLRDSNWDNDRFYPTILYVHANDLEKYEVARRDEGVKPQESRMVERWRSLGWWELNEEGKCSFIASMPNTSFMV